METHITLGNYTREGAAHMKEAPQRIEEVRKAVEAAGGKFVGWYLTMGQYDFVVITQGPDAATAARLLLAVGGQGNIRTETLRAFTEAEFKDLVAGLP
ncbi:MAG: GYD domain-containing protein [Anaerolineales bacterium]